MKRKITLEIELDDIYLGLSDDEVYKYLKQSLFETCEDWVLRGNEPYLKIFRIK